MSSVEPHVTGVFSSEAGLQAAVDHLEAAGFDRSQFGVLATSPEGKKAAEAETAGALAKESDPPTEALSDPESRGALSGALVGGLGYLGAMTAAGAILMTGGGLGLALCALVGAGGAGGLIGALVAHGFNRSHAEDLDEQLSGGGLVLWVQPRDEMQEAKAKAEFEAAGALAFPDKASA